MSAALALLGKDAREHAVAALALGAATLLIALVGLAQNAAAAYAVSAFEAVRFALLSWLPLVALVVGGRLVVREYLDRTRLFVEALPLGSGVPLALKYLLGLAYLSLLTLALVLLAARAAGVVDDATGGYVALMAAKSLAVVALYWSVVFCFSLAGHLRLVLYALLLGLTAFIAWWPAIDASRLAPFALLDAQLFVYERDAVPWAELGGTLALAALFVAAGFTLARAGDGSVAERLATPMTRTDLVALGVLAGVGITVAGALAARDERERVAFGTEHVLRRVEGPVSLSVLYAAEPYRAAGEALLRRTAASLAAVAGALGSDALPDVRVALAPELERHELGYSTVDGVFVRANWLAHDDYDDAVLDAVVLHGVLGLSSGQRATFAPYHWVLDGLARWWAEQAQADAGAAHESELLARAAHALARTGGKIDLVDGWQLLADDLAYPTAEAYAWSAVRYIELTAGRDAVLALMPAFFGEAVDENALATLRDRRRPTWRRIADATGLERDAFVAGWHAWLATQAATPAVRARLDAVPPLLGTLVAGRDAQGVYRLLGGYRPFADPSAGPPADSSAGPPADPFAGPPADPSARPSARPSVERDGGVAAGRDDGPAVAAGAGGTDEVRCVMKHAPLGTFDVEFDVDADYDDYRRDVADCRVGEAVHDVGSRYAPGGRIYVAFDVEFGAGAADAGTDAGTDAGDGVGNGDGAGDGGEVAGPAPVPFHQPLRLNALRRELRDVPLPEARADAGGHAP